MSTVISVEDVSKLYRLGTISSGTLSHDLNRAWARLRGKPDSLLKIGEEDRSNRENGYIWALRDVSFEVKEGEVLGIIGRNGAGKSTLLKILSRVTAPTSGQIKVKGRVASLLEVGTGFHPELTGRENVFLNGAILGMSRAEIQRKLDEIVAFAEVEKFIDTPVKRYSSGMYVRLAFAVAAHLEPEILLVDEVLAVGDAAFQKKCLGKMSDVARGGRTVLFVSHNMNAVRNLCDWTAWLQDGCLFQNGKTLPVTEAYLRQTLRADSLRDIRTLIRSLPPDPSFRLDDMMLRQNGQLGSTVLNGQALEIEIRYTVLQRTTGLRVYFDLLDDDQNILVRSFHDERAGAIPTIEAGHYVSIAVIPANLLAPRRYEIRVSAGIFNVRSCMGEGIVIPIVVESTNEINAGYPDSNRSKLQPSIAWETRT